MVTVAPIFSAGDPNKSSGHEMGLMFFGVFASLYKGACCASREST